MDVLIGKRIAIVGTGAVGGYYGGRLAQHGRDVHFLLRGDYEQVRRHGFLVKSCHGDFRLKDVHAYRSSAEIGPCDLVVIALKATQNDVLPELLTPLMKETTSLLTLQNGLGNEDFLATHFGAERVLGGLCFVCINRTAPGVVEHFSQGAVTLGDFARPRGLAAREVAEAFRNSGIEARYAEDLMGARWRKLVWNIPFNGLSIALGGIDVGEVLRDAVNERLVVALMEEVIALAQACGHPIPADFVEDQLTRTRQMGPYRPSSLIDYLRGAPVELEAIWGIPYRKSLSAGGSFGRLEALYVILKNLLQARQTDDTSR